MKRVCFAVLAALLLSGAVPTASTGAVPAEPDEIVFRTPPAGLPLFDAVRWIGENVTGSITFAPPALKIVKHPDARVVVTEPVTLRPARVLGFGQDLLAAHGLVLVNIGRTDQPLWLVESVQEPTVLAARAVFVPQTDVARHRWDRTLITTAVELRKAPLKSVRAEVLEAVSGSLPRGAAVIPVPATNGFILRGPGRNVHAWMQLIAHLDRPPAPGSKSNAGDDEQDRRFERLEKRMADLEAAKAGPDRTPEGRNAPKR